MYIGESLGLAGAPGKQQFEPLKAIKFFPIRLPALLLCVSALRAQDGSNLDSTPCGSFRVRPPVPNSLTSRWTSCLANYAAAAGV